MPKVSVIVPNYNHEKFLRRGSTASTARQPRTSRSSCSTTFDGPEPRRDGRVRGGPSRNQPHALQRAELGRPLSAMGQGIKAAQGDLVWIAESDDYCDERFLEVLVRCFDDEAVSARVREVRVRRQRRSDDARRVRDVRARPQNVRADGSAQSTRRTMKSRSALGIKNTIPNASGVVFKRPVDMPLLDDDSWLSMSVAGDSIFVSPSLFAAAKSPTIRPPRTSSGVTPAAPRRSPIRKRIFTGKSGSPVARLLLCCDVPGKRLERCRRTSGGPTSPRRPQRRGILALVQLPGCPVRPG